MDALFGLLTFVAHFERVPLQVGELWKLSEPQLPLLPKDRGCPVKVKVRPHIISQAHFHKQVLQPLVVGLFFEFEGPDSAHKIYEMHSIPHAQLFRRQIDLFGLNLKV